ncbi:ABC transporter substrate-binding protein [Catenovulum sediminis]|uniref:ABC transporter substrate-binding protein n=1 Tax=Catenovulum sediminis TaxID=1740262 RepID=A0ABV1RGE2_9ALTE|nr:ABC transporter substrate-binding protein [Catenovulum sediminis]
MQVFNIFSIFILLVSFTIRADDHYVYIGLDADLSAVAAEGGLAIKRGAEIAIDEINLQGGLLGKSVKLLAKDHRGNPARGLFNLKSFANNNKVIAILGGVHTPVVLNELEFIHQHKLVFLVPWAAGTPIVDNGYLPNYVFRVSVRDADAGQVLLQHAKAQHYKTITLLLENTGWGRSNKSSIQKAAKQLNLNINHIEWFNWRDQNLQLTTQRIAKSDTDAIILVANSPEGAEVIKGMASLPKEQRKPIISHWGITGGNFVQLAKIENLQKVKLSFLQTYSFLKPFSKETNQQLLAQYKKKYDESITAKSLPSPAGTAHAYDLVKLLAKAVIAADSFDSRKIQKALENITSHVGIVKHYQLPFSPAQHDALTPEDYQMCGFDQQGYIVPVSFKDN